MHIKELSSQFFLAFATVCCMSLLPAKAEDENDKPTRIPTPCEVCRVLASEMTEKMKNSSSKAKIDLGSKDSAPGSRQIAYSRSELRLIEVLESACEKVSDYYVHAKEGMQRYAKQESETLDALNGLRRRGVKVDIGIPWDIVEKQPNKEISALKRKCEALVEIYEDDLSAWYFQHQETPLVEHFCRDNILKNEDQACLSEPWLPYGEPRPDPEPKKEPEVKKKDEL